MPDNPSQGIADPVIAEFSIFGSRNQTEPQGATCQNIKIRSSEGLPAMQMTDFLKTRTRSLAHLSKQILTSAIAYAIGDLQPLAYRCNKEFDINLISLCKNME